MMSKNNTYRLFLTLLLGLLLLCTTKSFAQPSSGQAITENLEYFLVTDVGASFQTVTFRNTYTDPVVICSNVLPSASNNEAVTRIRNAGSNSFELRIQQPNDSDPGYTTNVYCMISDVGSYTTPFNYEARKVLADETNGAGNPNNWNESNAENVTGLINQNYSRPVVLGQVMTFNENRFSAFWSFDCDNRGNRPFQSGMSDGICVGKHIGQINGKRKDETLGFIVGEAGIYTTPSTNFAIDIGNNSVAGVGNNPPYIYSLDKEYTHGVVTQTAENGGQGGWAVLFGPDPLGATLNLAIDEETERGDTSRRHTNEEVSYFVFQIKAPDIGIIKTVDEPEPAESDTLQYTITATNEGLGTATGVEVEDILPAELSFISATPSQGTYDENTGMWIVGTINTGASATLTLQAEVNNGTNGTDITNTATLISIDQTDPNPGNNSASVTATVSARIMGTVFEDISADALADGDNVLNDAGGDQQGIANAKVLLYRDGGDGIPDGTDDVFVDDTVTNPNGEYQFTTTQSNYWIVIDSRSAGLSNGITWPEQTYAPAGAICSDGSGGSSVRTTAGPCYGGRRGSVSDAIPTNPGNGDLDNAEHIALVSPTSADVHFGFSFNAVTNIGDTDDDGSASRSKQGSLRQFIQNANAINGANAMRFVPAVALNQGSWWRVSLGAQLPTITGTSTTIDGTAYDYSDGVTIRNTNSGITGNSGSTVGVGPDGVPASGDEPILPNYELPELEINGNDLGNMFQVNAGNTIIRRLGMYNIQNSTAVSVTAGTGSEIRENLIGPLANGTDPGSGNRVSQAVQVSSGAANVLANRVAYIRGTGIFVSNNTVVSDNDIFSTGLTTDFSDGITVEGSNGQSISVLRNRIENIAAYGIESWQAPGPFTFENNTILDTGNSGSVEDGGIRIFGDGSTTRYNLVNGAAGPGIVVVRRTDFGQSSTGNLISRNSVFGNGELGIDLDQTTNSGNPNGDGISPNNGSSSTGLQNVGIDYPVFTKVTLSGNVLHVEGYVGTTSQNSTGSYTIELFRADDDGNNNGEIEAGDGQNVPHGEGRFFVADFTTNSDGTFNTDITVPNSVGLSVGEFITATTTNQANNTSEFGANAEVEQAGVSISGTVFSDANHNGIKEPAESGIEAITIVLTNTAQGTCQSIQTNANGEYSFSNVANGDYQIIESAAEATPNPATCPPSEEDPAGFVSTTSNTRNITVSGATITEQNFGNFNGSRLTGTVFNDSGADGGTANDAVPNGGESGISNVDIQALETDGTLIRQTSTDADGGYTLFIPSSAAPDGSTIRIRQINGTGFLSTGGNAGNSSGSYDIGTDEVTFNFNSGTLYTGFLFADVGQSRLLTDGQQTLAPGTSTLFQHTFEAKTAGDIVFSTQTTNNPSDANFSVVLYRDTNCDGAVSSGEPILDGTTPISVTANQTVCLLAKVTVPLGTIAGSSSTTTLTGSFSLANTSPVIVQTLSRTDLVTVSADGSGLVLVKSVDKPQALPGAELTYTISYQNNGSEPLNDLEIIDDTPSYTEFTSASCDLPLPNSLTNCSITSPAAGDTGVITWTFPGTLAPGQSGTVTYIVTITQ